MQLVARRATRWPSAFDQLADAIHPQVRSTPFAFLSVIARRHAARPTSYSSCRRRTSRLHRQKSQISIWTFLSLSGTSRLAGLSIFHLIIDSRIDPSISRPRRSIPTWSGRGKTITQIVHSDPVFLLHSAIYRTDRSPSDGRRRPSARTTWVDSAWIAQIWCFLLNQRPVGWIVGL